MNKIYNSVLRQGMKLGLIMTFIIVLVIWNFKAPCCLAKDRALGKLKIEGEHVEHLVLQDKEGRTRRFDKPGKTIELPMGQYQLQESHLDDGYVCFQRPRLQDKWITISENKPVVLKVGAPLKQTLKVKRRGKSLVLDYKLLGIGGESYNNNDRNKPPRLVVYNGDEEINSGRFEYG